MDGIVYGSAVGFGFAIAEDILYGMQYGAETFVVRRIFGGFAHAAFTSLTGSGSASYPGYTTRALRWCSRSWASRAPCSCIDLQLYGHRVRACGILGDVPGHFPLHVAHNCVAGGERRVIRTELHDEVAAGTITSQEYAILPSYFRRTGYYCGSY
jgi:hypothetical protein